MIYSIDIPEHCLLLLLACCCCCHLRFAYLVDEDAAEEAAAARAAAAERAAAAAAGPTRVVSIIRPAAMEQARSQLPIIGLEQEIMEGISHNDVVVSDCYILLLSDVTSESSHACHLCCTAGSCYYFFQGFEAVN